MSVCIYCGLAVGILAVCGGLWQLDRGVGFWGQCAYGKFLPAKTSNWVDDLSRPAMRLQRRSVGHCAGDDEDERQSSDRRSRTLTADVTEGDGFCGYRGRLNYPEIFVGKTQLWNPT
nr:hypothetical protein Itr_chr07CG09400 [Ipomoea trifida]